MNQPDVLSWLRRRQYGEPGSAKNFVHLMRTDLSGPRLAQMFPDDYTEKEKSEMIRTCALLSEKINYQMECYNSEFFRKLADGLDALKSDDLLTTRDPVVFMAWSYRFCCILLEDRLPTTGELIAMTLRYWALVRITGTPAATPINIYEPDFEAQIATEIKRLPEQKWSRHLKKLGLRLGRNRPGPKTSIDKQLRLR